MTLVVITAVPARLPVVNYLLEHLTDARIVFDQGKGAMETFRRAWDLYPDQPQIKLQDDILLTKDFQAKAAQVIRDYPHDVIQFFSRRREDLTTGTRWIAGSKWMMNQAHYLPRGMAGRIARFAETWDGYGENPTADDTLMADFFKAEKIRYLNVCPNLVDHLSVKSEIDSRRSTKRQSLTFEDPETRYLPETA